MPAVHVDVVRSARAVEVPRDRKRRVASQLGVIVPRKQRCVACDEVRFGVLVRAPRPGEVGHQASHAIAANNVRHHGRLSPSIVSSIRSATSRTLASVATVSACSSPVAFVALAIWLTLFEMAASSRCRPNSSAIA